MLTIVNFSQFPSRYANPFYEVFVASMVIVWLPFKVLSYFLPFIAIAWFIFRANSGKAFTKLLALIAFFALIICAYAVFYFIMGQQFVVQNAMLFLLTYSSFLFLFALPLNLNLTHINYLKYVKVIRLFIFIQASLGIFQVVTYVLINQVNFDTATGDVAQGTLNVFSFLDSGANFNNQIYTFNLLLLILFYLPHVIATRKGMYLCVFGFMAIALASVWHLLIAFLFSIIVVAIFFSRSFIKISTQRLLIAGFLTIAVSMLIVIQPKNFSLVFYYFKKAISYESPKALVTVNSLNDLPKEFPWVYFIGLGPGQYSSRAALIGTGHYFGDFKNSEKLPLITPGASKAFEKYIYPEWEKVATAPEIFGNSTMSRPFYSVLSILTELGYVIFIVLIFVIGVFVVRIKRMYTKCLQEKNLLKVFYSFSSAVLILFLILISFFENYLEVSQVVFPGILMLRYFYSFLKAT